MLNFGRGLIMTFDIGGPVCRAEVEGHPATSPRVTCRSSVSHSTGHRTQNRKPAVDGHLAHTSASSVRKVWM